MTSRRVPGGPVGGLVALAVLPFGACGGPGSAGDGASDSSSSDSGASTDVVESSSSSGSLADDSSSDDAATLADDDDGSSSTTEAPMPVCGDANVDPGEMCDDGNLVDGDGCDIGCVPSDPGQWSYVGAALTSLRALSVAPDGSVLAGGTYGNPFAFEADQALMRALDADGELVDESDAIVPGESYVLDVGVDAGGRFWLFGARVTNAWIYRVDDGDTDQINYGEAEAWANAEFGEGGIAVSSYAEVGWIDEETADVVWQTTIGVVDDSAAAPDGDVVVVGRPVYDAPNELRRFDADGDEPGVAVPLDGMSSCYLDASAIGTAVVGIIDEATLQSELRLFDDEGTLLWSTPLPESRFFGVTMTDDTIVLSGGVLGPGALDPVAMAFSVDGTELWTFLPDPTDYGVEAGYLGDGELAPDGAWIFAGALVDIEVDPFEPPVHAFVIRRPS